MTGAGEGNLDTIQTEAQLQRLNRAYRALSLCNGLIVHATSEQQLLQSLCDALVDAGGYQLAWVGSPLPDTQRVQPSAVAGSETARAYLNEIHVSTANDEHGCGPTGTAMRTAQIALNRNSSTNPAYGPWREQALRYGFRSSIALPLVSEARVLGALTVYADVPDAFDRDEQELLAHFAENLAYGIATLRAREDLAHVREQLQRANDVLARFAILDDAPNAFMALDREWRYVYINTVGARQVGHTPETLRGKIIWEVFPQAVGSGFWHAYQRAMNMREFVELEEYFGPQGAWFELRAYPIESGIAVYFSDVSARKQLEIAVRESEERFRQVAETIDDVFWLSDPDAGRVLYANPAYERIWGRARAQLYADASVWLDAIHPDDRARIAQSLSQQVLGGWDETYRITQPGGSVRFVRERAYPVRDSAGRTRRIVGVARDVTEYRRLEEQFRQAQKMEAVGRLAGGVAHDFNNMLSVILSYTSIALGDLKPDDPLRADMEEMQLAGQHAAALTGQLLAFSRQQVLQPRILDLRHVVLELENILRRVIGEDVELCLIAPHQLGKVRADASQVEQILMNLAVNARDAMPQGGKLWLETADVELDAGYAATHGDVLPGHYVMVAITDTGTGMEAATRDRIFEPFFTTKEQGKGTGLGLSTVFGIVKQSGGHISVYSELGHGTAFKVYFPRSTLESSPTLATAPEPATLLGTETVLLVEDNEQVRVLARAVLTRHGYNVLDAQNAGEAFLICEAHPGVIHMLLTDMVMPRLGGRELAKRLQGMRPELRVLYMSGYTEDFFVGQSVLDAGIAFLQKPITPDALLRKVREVFDTPSTPV